MADGTSGGGAAGDSPAPPIEELARHGEAQDERFFEAIGNRIQRRILLSQVVAFSWFTTSRVVVQFIAILPYAVLAAGRRKPRSRTPKGGSSS